MYRNVTKKAEYQYMISSNFEFCLYLKALSIDNVCVFKFKKKIWKVTSLLLLLYRYCIFTFHKLSWFYVNLNLTVETILELFSLNQTQVYVDIVIECQDMQARTEQK